MESFRLRDVEFKILVRNANVDIKEAVENVHLAFRGEVWAGDIDPGVIHEHGALKSVRE